MIINIIIKKERICNKKMKNDDFAKTSKVDFCQKANVKP